MKKILTPIPPKSSWHRFENDDEKILFMKKHGLLTKTAKYAKRVVYSGACVEKPELCEIVGHDRDYSCVLNIHGQLHAISPDYLAEMQAGKTSAGLPEQYIVLDFETTGLDATQDEVIEIAALKIHNGINVDSFETLVNPGFPLPEIIQEITGIMQEEVNAAPVLETCIYDFHLFLDNLPIIAHNASFERKFLEQMFLRFDLDFNNPMLDSISLAKKAFPGLLSYSLESLKYVLDLPCEQSHRAMADVENTTALVQLCATTIAEKGIQTVQEAKQEAPKDAQPSLPDIDISPSSILNGKSVVFTGELGFTRKAATDMATKAGANVRTTVSKKTDYLVIGQQDGKIVGINGMSEKEETARRLIAEGETDLKIINEAEFLRLLEEPNPPENVQSQIAGEKNGNQISDKELIAFRYLLAILAPSLLEEGLDPTALTIKPLNDRCSVFLGKDTNVFCRLRFRGKKCFVELPIQFSEEAKKYGDVETPVHKATGTFASKDSCKLICKKTEDLKSFSDLFLYVYNREIEELPTDFGCCSRYLECSNAKKCVNPDKEMALQYYYLKNLRKGKIFYGENKIDSPILFQSASLN